MAVMQILLIVTAFVQKYDFTLAKDAPVEIQPMMLLRPGGAVALKFRAVA
jgi:hypothetical protein